MWQKDSLIYYQDFIKKVEKWTYFFFAALFFLIFYLFFIQIIKGDYYWKRSEKNRLYVIVEKSPRGTIFDSMDRVIAESSLSHSVLFYPFSKSNSSIKETSERISGILKQPKSKISGFMSESIKSGKVVQIAKRLTREQLFAIKEHQNSLHGISISGISKRNYYGALQNSHLIGYLGEADQSFLRHYAHLGYKLGDVIGKSGVENQYDLHLKGADGGWQIEVDVLGKHKRFYNYLNPQKGNNVKLSIDWELQKTAYDAISQTGHPGAAVAIEASSGRVLLFVSAPGFESNLAFQQDEESAGFWRDVCGDPKKPLLNRAVAGLYPPGSIFKIITLIAALKEGLVAEDTKFFCDGKFNFGDRTFKCWKKEGHRRMDLRGAFENSCNVYFYQLGLKIGSENLLRHAKIFNLDKKTSVDYPQEKSGNIPSKLTQDFGGESINLAIGQGPLLTTPFQLAHFASIIANRGKIMKPFIMDKVFSYDNETIVSNSPLQVGEITLESSLWDKLIKYMRGVVDSGTGRACYIEGVPVAGKTGTAQNPHGDDHALFVCFAPEQEPRIALAVLIENGGSGGAVAAPVAKKILSRYLEVTPTDTKATSRDFGN